MSIVFWQLLSWYHLFFLLLQFGKSILSDKYARTANKRKIRIQLLGRIASDIAFLAEHYEDDEKVSELVELVLPWFEEREILVVDKTPKSNVIDFAEFVRNREIFSDPE